MDDQRRDLSEQFRIASRLASTWDQEKVSRTLQELVERASGSRIDWEPGDEHWGRVIDADGNVVAMVCARIPVGAVRDGPAIRPLPEHVEWIVCRSLDDRSYRIDRALLEQIFARRVTDALDYSALSLDHLWWATVT